MSPQDIFISDIEDSAEFVSNDVKVASQHLPSYLDLSNDFKTEDQVITLDSQKMYKKLDRKKIIISKDKPFFLPRERIYKQIYVPTPGVRHGHQPQMNFVPAVAGGILGVPGVMIS